MTGEGHDRKPRSLRMGFGHHWRLLPETQALTMVLLGLATVFAIALAHDEIVHAMVEAGWIAETRRELVEILFGLVTFAAWSMLTLAFASLVRGGRQEAVAGSGAPRSCSGNGR
jgi:hypothetical protein